MAGTSRHNSSGYQRFRHWLRGFWKYSRQSFWVLLVTILAVQAMESWAWFQALDHAFLDIFAALVPAKIPTGVYIIEITDEDYKDYFKSTSPLHPETVLDLINLIRQAGPAVIGVDL